MWWFVALLSRFSSTPVTIKKLLPNSTSINCSCIQMSCVVWEKAGQSDKQEASKCPGQYWRIASHHHLIVHALFIYTTMSGTLCSRKTWTDWIIKLIKCWSSRKIRNPITYHVMMIGISCYWQRWTERPAGKGKKISISSVEAAKLNNKR